MFDFLSDNNLLSRNQSGFRSGDSCINQHLSINHEILYVFDKGLELRAIFLDISKAFDKYGMMVLFLNYVKMVSAEISSTFYKTFFLTEDKE